MSKFVVIAGKKVTPQNLQLFRALTARKMKKKAGTIEYPPHISGHRLSGSRNGTMIISLTESLSVTRRDSLIDELFREHKEYVSDAEWLRSGDLKVCTRASRRDHNPNCRRNACLDMPKIVSQIVQRLLSQL